MRSLSIILAVLLVGATAWTPGGETNASAVAPMDCTVTIKGNFDGMIVNVTITVSNTNLAECLLLKAGVKAAIKAPSK